MFININQLWDTVHMHLQCVGWLCLYLSQSRASICLSKHWTNGSPALVQTVLYIDTHQQPGVVAATTKSTAADLNFCAFDSDYLPYICQRFGFLVDISLNIVSCCVLNHFWISFLSAFRRFRCFQHEEMQKVPSGPRAPHGQEVPAAAGRGGARGPRRAPR
jgi:hypothetical protein